jgi:hypothetical protein
VLDRLRPLVDVIRDVLFVVVVAEDAVNS